MLIISIFFILTAVALPSVQATPSIHIRTTSLIFLISLFLVVNSFHWNYFVNGISLYNGLTNLTGIAIMGQALFLGIGSLALIPWAPLKTNGFSSFPRISTYSLFAIMTSLGACILVSCGDIITFYLALELQSFSVYILAALYRDSESATHAGLLYFLLGGLSSSFILLGFALIYSETGMTQIDNIMNLMNVSNEMSSISWSIYLGFISVATGILFKITAAPFHNWGPDVYDGVPTIVTTWLAVIPKISLILLFLIISIDLNESIKLITSNFSSSVWSTLLLVSSILSLLIGTIVGLVQSRIKRLLAYSTISHIGFILMSMSISNIEGGSATIFYLMQYSVTALLSFSSVLAMGYITQSSEKSSDLNWIKDLTNIVTTNPGVSTCLATALFSMAGVPPLLGFYGKQSVLYAAINSGLYFVSFVAVVTSVISASYYLYLVRVSYFDNSNNSNQNSMKVGNITSVHSYTLSLLTLMIISFMASPNLILDSCRLVTIYLYQ